MNANAQARILPPEVAPIADVTFPERWGGGPRLVERYGGWLLLPRRKTTVPAVRVTLVISTAGRRKARSQGTGLGTNALMMALLDEGTATRNSARRSRQTRSGLGRDDQAPSATIDRNPDRAMFSRAESPILPARLDLLAEHWSATPAFRARPEIERGLRATVADPASLPEKHRADGDRACATLPADAIWASQSLWGGRSPDSGRRGSGSRRFSPGRNLALAFPRSVDPTGITANDLRRAAIRHWPRSFRLPRALRFGDWKAPADANAGVQAVSPGPGMARPPPDRADRPAHRAPQSMISGG